MKEFIDFFFRNWFLIVILGNLFIAVSNIMSKVVLSGTVAKPLAPGPYAFFTGLGGLLILGPALVLNLWFNFLKTDPLGIFAGFVSGFFFILSLWLFYYVASHNETSRITTVIIGAVPLFAFLFSFTLVGERFGAKQILAFCLLVISGILVSLRHHKTIRYAMPDLLLTIFSALLFAAGAVLASVIFSLQGFLSGIVWVAGGYVLASLALFIWPSQRKAIFSQNIEKKNVAVFFFEKAFQVTGSFMTKFSLSLASPALVTAFDGTKQFMILGIAAFLSSKYPRILKEEMESAILWSKILAAIFVSIGIILLII